MVRNKKFLRMVLISIALLLAGFIAADLFEKLWIMAAASVLIIVIFIFYTWQRYYDIQKLAAEVHRFQRSGSRINLESYSEGELSYLSSEIGKLSVKMTEQADMLKNDKNYLADAISDISHQLKTPLTSMSMMADFLNDPHLPETRREEFTSNICTQLARIEWLVSALLKMARLDAGTVLLKKEPVNVQAVIQKASAHLLIPMELKNQHLCVDCAADMSFLGDMDWMSEALANILKNCIEHMGSDQSLHVKTVKNPMYTRIDILDEGCGIDKEDLPHIFERFYKGKNATSDSVGIGLAMANQIIHRQNGDITVESEIDQGTHFMIKIYT